MKRSGFRYFSKVALRFRRWSRHSYSAFCSIGKTVTIGHLSQGIADASLRKDKGIQSVSLSKQLPDADGGFFAAGFCRTEDFPPDLASLWNLFLLMPGALFLRIQSPAGLVCKSLPAEHESAVRGTMPVMLYRARWKAFLAPSGALLLCFHARWHFQNATGHTFAGKSRPLDMRNGSHLPWSIRRKWISSKSKEYFADNNLWLKM